MNLPADIKRNSKCIKIIDSYKGDIHSKWARGEVKKIEKTPIDQRTIRDQFGLCLLYRTVTNVPLNYSPNILNEFCSDCEIHDFVEKWREFDNLLTRKSEIEKELEVIDWKLKKDYEEVIL